MHHIAMTQFRANITSELKRVDETKEPTLITRRQGEPAVLLGMTEWNSIQETMHLLSTPANSVRLTESIAQANAGLVSSRGLITDGQQEHK